MPLRVQFMASTAHDGANIEENKAEMCVVLKDNLDNIWQLFFCAGADEIPSDNQK